MIADGVSESFIQHRDLPNNRCRYLYPGNSSLKGNGSVRQFIIEKTGNIAAGICQRHYTICKTSSLPVVDRPIGGGRPRPASVASLKNTGWF